jgi:hypothetical protein
MPRLRNITKTSDNQAHREERQSESNDEGKERKHAGAEVRHGRSTDAASPPMPNARSVVPAAPAARVDPFSGRSNDFEFTGRRRRSGAMRG